MADVVTEKPITEALIDFDVFLLVLRSDESLNLEAFNRVLDYFGLRLYALKESPKEETIEKLIKIETIVTQKDHHDILGFDSILLRNFLGPSKANTLKEKYEAFLEGPPGAFIYEMAIYSNQFTSIHRFDVI